MSIISKYLLRLHFVPFVFALSALTSIMLVNQIARRLPDLVGKGLPWTVIVEVFALSIPFLVAMTIPMAVLTSVLYTMSRLTADNELTALRASGVSLVTVSRTVLMAACGVAAIAFLFSDQILPRTNHRLRTLLTDITRTKPTFALEEQVINEVKRNNLFLRAGSIDQVSYTMRDVTIFDLSNHNRKRVTYADSAYMAFDQAQEDLYLTLFNGTMHESDRVDQDIFRITDFNRDIVKVEDVSGSFARTENDTYKGDREMGVCEMDTVIKEARAEAWSSEARAAAVEFNSLRGLIGLAPVVHDTVPPAPGTLLYCRALEWITARLKTVVVDTTVVAESPDGEHLGDEGRRVQLGEGALAAAVPTDSARWLAQRAAARAALLARGQSGDSTKAPSVVAPLPRISTAKVLADRARSGRIREANYLVEVHKKYSIALASIVFVLVGIPAAIRFPRGGVGLVIGVSLAVFGVFYVGLIGGESLANKLIVPPFWAMWAPNILFGVIGTIALLRLASKSTSSRNGTPVDALRSWIPGLRPRRA